MTMLAQLHPERGPALTSCAAALMLVALQMPLARWAQASPVPAPTPATAAAPPAAELLKQAADKVGGWAWRGIGDPLVLGRSVVLFGADERTGKPIARRLDWDGGGKVTDIPLAGLPLHKDNRYTSGANSAGIWMAGPSLALVTPAGQVITAPAGTVQAERPPMVAMPDGSALIFRTTESDYDGKSSILRARLAADGKSLVVTPVSLLSYDGTPNVSGKPYHSPLYGHNVQLLADGRVLMFGDERTAKLASIFDPATQKMKPVAEMPNGRAVATSTRLEDGRVVVAGGIRLRCYGPEARKVDLYDVAANRWSSLPDLPLPLCAEAYGAWQPSMVQASNGSLVLGGGLEPELLVLEREPKGPLGFARDWQRVGRLGRDRIGGRLQALPGARVAVIGGLHNPEGSGSCCERTTGIDIVDLKGPEAPFFPGGLTLNGPGMAQRGHKLFIAGGRRFMMTDRGQMRFASHAELLDLKTGARTQLPQVPIVAGALDAYWVDDDRVIVKGLLAGSDRGFEENLSSYIPDGSARMALFSVSANRWQVLELPDLQEGRLLGVTRLPGRAEPLAVIGSPRGPLFLVVLTAGLPPKPRFEIWPGETDTAGGKGTARLLPDGRVVLSGETAASDLISVIDSRCEGPDTPGAKASKPGPACKETFVEIGDIKPANTLRVLSLANPDAPGLRDVGPPPLGQVRNAVTLNGDVVRLVWEQPKTEGGAAKPGAAAGWALWRWRMNARQTGASWERLPVPSHWTRGRDGLGEPECGNGAPGYDASASRCQILALDDPRDASGRRSLIFLRATVANRDYAWSQMQSEEAEQSTTLHLYDETSKRWIEVLRMTGAAARAAPQTIKALPGQSLKSIGWHLPRPALWVD